MRLTYTIGDDLHEESFDFEVDNLRDFIQSLPIKDLVDFAWDALDGDSFDDYGLPHDEVGCKKALLDDQGILKEVLDDCKDCFEELFEDDIKEYYQDEAMDYYDDAKEYARDPHAYYGVSRSDFF